MNTQMKLTGIIISLFVLIFSSAFSQSNIVTYAGNSGKDNFYDVMQISDGTFLVCGYSDDLSWINPSVPQTTLGVHGIHNGLGSNRYGYILQISSDLQSILHVVKFPQGAVEDVRFIKTNTPPGVPTGDLYISGNTSDTYANDGGYYLAKLNNNFINGIPTDLIWARNVWAETGPKDYQPWDVTNDGHVFYISGQAHAYDWAAIYSLDNNGNRRIVNNWRTHWLIHGGEWKGTPASSYPNGGLDSVSYSGIVLKIWGRCDLRSWTQNEYDQMLPDGNGGLKKGKWPIDILFDGPCDPANPTANSPGYTGYSAAACCPVYGGSNIAIDKRTNDVYIGMNMKSVAPNGSPDFEPAVIAMDSSGTLKWWSRLYHEITPAGDTMVSIPDQYVDALAIDYSQPADAGTLIVGGRTHGNNVENFWEGNTVSANPSAYGFRNQFTGTNGNIHESWLGKLKLLDGTLMHCTYVAEYAEGTGGLGTPHPDPNLDGWPDPNTGWPDVNTTRLAKNNMKVTAAGWVCIGAVGRRTITTANAYQKMVKPDFGGQSCWNSFVRVYNADLTLPYYSSLVVGQWDTLTQQGGSNTDIFGLFKTANGIVAVGRQTADTLGNAIGNDLPVINVPGWGNSAPSNETAVLVYYTAANIVNPDDSPVISGITNSELREKDFFISPNPAKNYLTIWFKGNSSKNNIQVRDVLGRLVIEKEIANNGSSFSLDVSKLEPDLYFISVNGQSLSFVKE
ncbi:MAG: T9SS type A sorting domain-containing protein [Bacteroidetes bacterium]|nr:T9SS type A sorting domain-containing protein [Bacteroidota bacterium]